MTSPSADPKSIFDQAVELRSPVARARFLADACGDDPALRGEVDNLLWAYEVAGHHPGVIPPAPMMSGDDPPEGGVDDERSGSVIGPYRLVEVIGRGGMGVVYLAEQSGPIRRKVALKIIRPGLDSSQVIARFEAERQALALMDHANIAKVLDAGSTGSGLPYFVMELVEGLPITEYCERAQMPPAGRVELLEAVCRAIQHAHQKGIIHRDIKPSNVLVADRDGVPVPKVIDFGVAKAVDQRLTERTLVTHHETIVGTLEYMSPEQAEPGSPDVDTRSDVYSLGVLLYELLTGTTPLGRGRMKEAGLSEILRRIREEDPPRPSSRVASAGPEGPTSDRLRIDSARLARLARGELDWIAMKALEKDPARRYATANDLARDLRRHLDGEPIEAGPPSSFYRIRKFARRHRAMATFAGSLAAVLIAATAISASQAVRASRAADQAAASEAEARSMFAFVRDRVLAAARPRDQAGGLGREATLRDVIGAAEPKIAADFAAHPASEAAVRDALGITYQILGDAERSIAQHAKALALREAALGPEHPDTLVSMNNLATAYRSAGRAAEAIALHERDLRISREKFGPDDPRAIVSESNLASAYKLAGRYDRAIAMLERVLKIRESRLLPDHPDILKSLNQLAAAYQAAGRPEDAIPLHRRDLDASVARLGAGHPETLTAMTNLAAAYQVTGKLDQAIPILEQSVALRRDRLGRDHPDTLSSMNNLAAARHLAGRTPEAVALFEEVVALRKSKLRPGHPDTIKSMSNLAQVYQASGRGGEALPLFEDVLRLRRAEIGADHPDTIKSLNLLAEADLKAARWPEAEALLREFLRAREPAKADDWQRFHAMSLLGAALAGRGANPEAEPLLIGGLEGLIALRAKAPPRRQGDLAAAADRLARFYEATGKPDQAAAWRAKAAPAPAPGKAAR